MCHEVQGDNAVNRADKNRMLCQGEREYNKQRIPRFIALSGKNKNNIDEAVR